MRKTDRHIHTQDRQNSLLLVHSLNGPASQGRIRLKLGARNSIQVSR